MSSLFGTRGRYEDYPWFQRVWADQRVAVDVFERMDARGRAELGPVDGLVPRFDELASKTFRPDAVDPLVRAFYEHTTRFEIEVQHLAWRRWARPLSLPYRWITGTLGNLRVPPRIDEPRDMSSDVRRIDLRDGGASRAWTRTFSGTNEAFYAAAVRVHTTPDESFLSLAFPLPRAHLAVVLRVENHGASGVRLTTRRGAISGTYLVLAGEGRFTALPGPPTSEELTFEARPDGVMVGSHVDRLLGRTAFEMRYEIRRRPGT